MRGKIVCPKCGDGALYDTDYGEMAIHEYIPGPFLFPTNVCYLNIFQRWRSRRLLEATAQGQNHPGWKIEARGVRDK